MRAGGVETNARSGTYPLTLVPPQYRTRRSPTDVESGASDTQQGRECGRVTL